MYLFGNYGICFFYVVGWCGIFCIVVMLCIVLQVKKDVVWGYGGCVVECELLILLCEVVFVEVVVEIGVEFVYFYNDYCVIVGQVICFVELIEQVDGFDVVVVLIGGGGMVLGSCLMFFNFVFGVKIYVVEFEQVDDVYCSFKVGCIIVDDVLEMVVDGLKVLLKELIWYFVKNNVIDILMVFEQEIVDVMKLIWKCMKIVMELFSVVLLVIILKNFDVFVGKCVGVIVMGGNVDFDKLLWN